METIWKILATLGLVGLNGFFVAAEFAAVGPRTSRLELDAGGSLAAALGLQIKRKLDLFLSSCQLGVTLASLGLGAVTEPAVAALLQPMLHGLSIPGPDLHAVAFAVALGLATSLHIVIGEQAPKNWAISYADRLLPVLAGPLVIFTYVFYPVIWLLHSLTRGLLRWTGVRTDLAAGGLPHTERELRTLLAQAVAQGSIAKGQARILTSAFEFNELKVRQIMIPRTRVDFLLIDQPIDQVLQIVQRTAYTRLPLCQGDIDHVVGLVHMKDLFAHLRLVAGKLRFTDESTPQGEVIAIPDGLPGSATHVIGVGDIDLRQIKREVLFVPELLPAGQLLGRFQTQRVHMAIVVDEYGATQGIITLEDVLEQLVGEIEDEFDPMSPADFVAEGDHFRVSGLFPLHELRERLGLSGIEAADVDTVGGYITQQLNRWPRPGDTVRLDRFEARVVSVQQKRVGQVLISPAREPTGKTE